MTLSRRRLLRNAGAAGLTLALGGCTGEAAPAARRTYGPA